MLIVLAYVLIGVVAGSLAGLLGIGGGILIVPCLAWIYSLQGFSPANVMHMAGATCLAAMTLSAAASVYTHYRRGSQIWPVYRRLAIGVVIGTIVGVILAGFLHTRVLEAIFGILLLAISAMMFFGFKPAPHRQLPGKYGLNAVSLLIGVKSGLLGLGGGVISVPYLSYCNVPMRNAVGISTAISLTVAIIGSISFMISGLHVPNLPRWSTGYVYWPGVLGIAIVSPIFASLGATLSHRLPIILLRRIFAGFLLLMGLRMLF